MTTPRVPREEIVAALAARRELGPEYDEAFVETIVDRIEESLTARQAAHEQSAPAHRPRAYGGLGDLALPAVSLVVAVPLGASAVVHSGNTALFFVLTAIVLINFAHALRRRRD